MRARDHVVRWVPLLLAVFLAGCMAGDTMPLRDAPISPKEALDLPGRRSENPAGGSADPKEIRAQIAAKDVDLDDTTMAFSTYRVRIGPPLPVVPVDRVDRKVPVDMELYRPGPHVRKVWLGAFLNTHTGFVQYQVYVHIRYNNDWRVYEWVSYQDGDVVQHVPLTSLIRKPIHGSDTYDRFVLEEVVNFDVPETVLRAASAVDMPAEWRMHLHTRAGWVLGISLPIAEIAGLLEHVDEHAHP